MMLMPLGVALATGESAVISAFLIPMLASFALVALIYIPFHKSSFKINTRQTYMIVAG